MSRRNAEIQLIRNLIQACDRRSSLSLLHRMQVCLGSMMDPKDPGDYVLDLLPEITRATAALLAAMDRPRDHDLQACRRRLLSCFDSLLDEIRLQQRSVRFLAQMLESHSRVRDIGISRQQM